MVHADQTPMAMTTIYWYCLAGGFGFTLILVLLADLLDGAIDALDGAFDAIDLGGIFDPLSLVAAVTVFGGAGLLLNGLGLPGAIEVTAAVAISIVLSLALHFLYVKPMKRSENSTGFSRAEYAGKTGELTTGLSATGFGEVVIRMGASTTFQTATSFSGEPIADGTPVVVVEVNPDGVLQVAPLSEEDRSSPSQTPRSRLQTRV